MADALLGLARFRWFAFRHSPLSQHRDPAMARPMLNAAAAEPESLLSRMGTTPQGLTAEEVAVRLRAVGPNLVAHERRQSLFAELVGRARNPLNFLLLSLAAVSYFLGDKTGTLTQDKIILMHHFDLNGRESARVLEYAYLNSHFQSGLKNLLDVAVLDHVELKEHVQLEHRFEKIDELPFDFSRRRMSVVLATEENNHILICKGAVEEVFAACTHFAMDGAVAPLDASHLVQMQQQTVPPQRRWVSGDLRRLQGDRRATIELPKRGRG